MPAVLVKGAEHVRSPLGTVEGAAGGREQVVQAGVHPGEVERAVLGARLRHLQEAEGGHLPGAEGPLLVEERGPCRHHLRRGVALDPVGDPFGLLLERGRGRACEGEGKAGGSQDEAGSEEGASGHGDSPPPSLATASLPRVQGPRPPGAQRVQSGAHSPARAARLAIRPSGSAKAGARSVAAPAAAATLR